MDGLFEIKVNGFMKTGVLTKDRRMSERLYKPNLVSSKQFIHSSSARPSVFIKLFTITRSH